MEKNKFIEPSETVTAGTALSNCHSISIFNISPVGVIMYVNGAPLAAGMAYISEGVYGDFNEQKYIISFEPNTNLGKALIVRKIYQ